MTVGLWGAALACLLCLAVAAPPGARGPDSRRDAMGSMHVGQDAVLPVQAFTPALTPLSRTGWTATASDQETAAQATAAANVLDGSSASFWHSRWSGTAAALPHWVQIDMGAPAAVAGLAYLPRQDGIANGRIGQFSISVSTDAAAWTVVATGTWADDAQLKTAQFASVTGRYVRLTGLSEAGGRGPWSSAAELNLLAPAAGTVDGDAIAATGWSATASDQETAAEGAPASAAIDGDPATIWHSAWSGAAPPLPHWIQIDLGAARSVRALTYRPRQDGNPNGRIGSYRVSISANGANFTTVASGTWLDDSATKAAVFTAVSTRYIRLTALTEAGNRGPWSSAAEIGLVSPAGTPPATTGVPGPLPHTGWVTTASDSETAAENATPPKATDGLPETFWHSRWSGTPAPMPHWIQVDLGASRSVNGLVYRPRQDGNANGRIGQYQVATSSNGATFATAASGTWADDSATKTATFPAVTARYVRLTAVTEAGGRGPWTAVAELDVLSPEAQLDASKVGAWSNTTTFPLVPVAAAVLPNNKMVLWSSYSPVNFGGANGYTQTAIYDLTSGKVSQRTVSNTAHDMFCPGVVMLADGRIMVTGGDDAAKTSIYDPASDTWAAGPPMRIARGYQAMTLLSNGDAFVLGGSWSGPRGGKTAEVWNAATGWRTLTGVPADPIYTADAEGVYRSDNHAWLVAASGGRVFHAGPSRTMHWITTAGSGSITSAGTRADAPDMMNGNAVVYDIGKILTVGGAPSYQDSDATARAYTVDINGAAPVTKRVSDLASPRAFVNSVVLPDGKVLTIGGQPRPVPFTDTNAAMSPELWDPATGRWTTMAPMAVPRTYHGVALLLPDARVFSGGGGLCGGCAVNHADGETFTPPYLLNADGSARARPSITSAPGRAALGSTMTVATDRAVTSFSLVRMGEATHSVDNDQRRVPLPIATTSGTTYTLKVPADAGTVLPGTWMLFALDAKGTPSKAAIVTIPAA
jgi:galactose oxidase